MASKFFFQIFLSNFTHYRSAEFFFYWPLCTVEEQRLHLASYKFCITTDGLDALGVFI